MPNFNDVAREIVSLNQMADRRVTPTLKPGVESGTMDVDLNVKDTFPLHGSLESNNRYSANTTPLRLNGSLDAGVTLITQSSSPAGHVRLTFRIWGEF